MARPEPQIARDRRISLAQVVPRSGALALVLTGLSLLSVTACDGSDGDPGGSDAPGGAPGEGDDRAAAECLSPDEPEWAGPWDDCAETEDPGFHVCTDEAPGNGACAGSTLREIIELTHETFPDLEAATDLYDINENDGESGRIVYAFTVDDGGFRLVFQQGRGDCPSGCTEGTFTYVETNESCEPEIVGQYEYTIDGCSGEPMWGLPCSEHRSRCDE